MLFNTRMILGYVIAALAGVPALANAAALDNISARGPGGPSLPKPTCFDKTAAGSCTETFEKYCDEVSQISFNLNDGDRRCYGGLSDQSGNYKCNFAVSSTNAGPDAKPDKFSCLVALQNIADNCESGGYGTDDEANDFLFRVYNDVRDGGVCLDASK